ncbi:MFS transporter [Acidisoma cellulosilytica]|uniref:MFS transporter n=1 Tax=Acidisoma cellulosilyticum TaxID=2802395 RepID=A0A964E3R4_9PROT|nr:MFS transporter [Acidisoma cellulosilyticum]MCB8880502.1 MFS transporter [Acidisoma cellulosilyticum]
MNSAADIGARLDRLPGTRRIWTMVILLSLGGCFEYFDLFLTGYIAPGLVHAHIFTATTAGFFGNNGIASFVAAFFIGLFIGTLAFGFVADRFGRRRIFTISLIWYSLCTLIMAFQKDAAGINLWRLLSGIGIGVELVTIDSYISELMPKHLRGRAFVINAAIQFSILPIAAALAWWLVPQAPMGIDGWRWLVMIGAAGAVVVWFIRRPLPESPRWLAGRGKIAEADRIVALLEAEVPRAELAVVVPAPEETVTAKGRLREIWHRRYLARTVMLILFNVFQAVGYYGFANWVPTFLIQHGITITHSLEYTFLIAIAAPFAPLLFFGLADKVERKVLVIVSAAAVAVFGLCFSEARSPLAVVGFGVLVTMANNVLSFAFHSYQAELYPTRIRAVAVGFVYSWSRLSVIFMAFVIAFTLRGFGVSGVFMLIAGSMVVVIAATGLLGPRTRNRSLEEIAG